MTKPDAVASVESTITLTRNQLADICYSAAVQGRESIFDQHAKMSPGEALNQIAEGIADNVISNPDQWKQPGLRSLK